MEWMVDGIVKTSSLLVKAKSSMEPSNLELTLGSVSYVPELLNPYKEIMNYMSFCFDFVLEGYFFFLWTMPNSINHRLWKAGYAWSANLGQCQSKRSEKLVHNIFPLNIGEVLVLARKDRQKYYTT